MKKIYSISTTLIVVLALSLVFLKVQAASGDTIFNTVPVGSISTVTPVVDIIKGSKFLRETYLENHEPSYGVSINEEMTKHHLFEKSGKSLFAEAIQYAAVTNGPPGASKFFANEKISKKEDLTNDASYIKRYGLDYCVVTDHKYTSYRNLFSHVTGKYGTAEATNTHYCTGPKGQDPKTVKPEKVDDPPDVREEFIEGESDIKIGKDLIYKIYKVRADSHALLRLKLPEENLCIQYGRYLVNECAKMAASTFLPGGFILSSTGAVTKMTAAMENAIFKNNPTWLVTLRVTATALRPKEGKDISVNNALYTDTEEIFDGFPVACANITVAGKKPQTVYKTANTCEVIVGIHARDAIKDVTPSVSGYKYFRYNIEVVGDPVRQVKKNVFGATVVDTSLIDPDTASDDGYVPVLDEDGFIADGPEDVPKYSLENNSAVADTVAPSIPTNLSAKVVSSSQVYLSWSPSIDNVKVNGYIIYRNSIPVGIALNNQYSDMTLAANTSYVYKIRSYDASGNISDYSLSKNISTPSIAVVKDTVPPVISTVSYSLTSPARIYISWYTNENSDTQVDYGQSSSYGHSSLLNSTMTTSHSIDISALNPGTTYHFRVKSKDSEGNVAMSSDNTFTTTNTVVSTPQNNTNNNNTGNSTTGTVPRIPIITKISPTSGSFGDTIIISGTNFDGAIEDTIFISNANGSINPTFISANSGEVKIKVPNIPTGTYTLYLLANNGESNHMIFRVIAPPNLTTAVMDWFLSFFK